jgi:hypothetical protein
MARHGVAIFAAALAAACSVRQEPSQDQAPAANAVAPAPPAAPAAPAPPQPDRTPTSEAPFSDTSAQSAANVVQTYYALVEAGRYDDAFALLGQSELGREQFAAQFGQYRDYHAEVFAPGEPEGAAGSIYVDVPARIYGAMRSGEAFDRRVTVTVRRVNDVDGSTAEQRRWHIARIAEPR